MAKLWATIKQSRYAILVIYGVIFLASSLLMRALLYLDIFSEIHASGLETLAIFFIGGFYDLIFLFYFSIFFALLLLLIPQRLYSSRFFYFTTFFFFFLLVYGLYFVDVAEWLYWQEFHTRFNFIAIDYLMYSYEVTHNISESYPLFWIFSAIFVGSWLTMLAVRRPLAEVLQAQESVARRGVITSIILMLPLLAYLGIGQSLREFADNSYINALSGNGPYQFFAAFRNNTLDYQFFYAQGDEEKLSVCLQTALDKKIDNSTALFDISRPVPASAMAKKLNIILISVESLSADFLTSFGQPENITPFMDKWFDQGLLFTNFYATGTRTTRGLESLTLSVPPTPGRSLVKRPDNARIFSLGKVLHDNGYDTVFLYGGRGFFDNMNAFFAGNGYRVIDETDIAKKDISFKNAWGVADEDIYRQAVRVADDDAKAGRPFFLHIMTTSNHRPYSYPAGRIDIPSGSGRFGAVKYTDYALQELLRQAKEHDWFSETLFVVVADHCASSAGRAELPVARYHIPLFIYGPKYIKPQKINKLAGQIDVAPTLLGLLGLGYKSYFFGQDILSDSFQERAFIGNYQHLGLLAQNELAILAPIKQIDVIKDPRHNEHRVVGQADEEVVQEAMAFYQGADYILRHRLNRW